LRAAGTRPPARRCTIQAPAPYNREAEGIPISLKVGEEGQSTVIHGIVDAGMDKLVQPGQQSDHPLTGAFAGGRQHGEKSTTNSSYRVLWHGHQGLLSSQQLAKVMWPSDGASVAEKKR